MLEAKRNWQTVKTATCAGACALIASSCISTNDTGTATQVTPQGTVPLETVHAGLPEEIFKSAHVTFQVDTSPGAKVGGKTQYLSRMTTAKNNGQYLAQCKDDKCYEIQILYRPVTNAKSVSKEDALAAMKQLAPADAGEPTEDDQLMKNKKATIADELFYFGNKYLGILTFDDKSAGKVNTVTVYALPPQMALTYEFGALGRKLSLPDSAKSDSVAQAAPSGSASEH